MSTSWTVVWKHALPPPTDEDVVALTERIVARVARLLGARDADAGATEPPELDDLAHAQTEAVQLPRAVGTACVSVARRRQGHDGVRSHDV